MSFDEKHHPKAEEAAYESVGVPAQEEPIPHEERLLVRKLDRRILPIACLMYLFACQSSPISCYRKFHHCDSRFGQKQLGQRSHTGLTCRYTRRGSHGQEVRLGQFRLFLLLCENNHPLRARNLNESLPHLRFEQVLCQVPATILAKFFPPRLFLGCAAIGWGLCSTLMVGRLFTLLLNAVETISTSSPPPSTRPGLWWPE